MLDKELLMTQLDDARERLNKLNEQFDKAFDLEDSLDDTSIFDLTDSIDATKQEIARLEESIKNADVTYDLDSKDELLAEDTAGLNETVEKSSEVQDSLLNMALNLRDYVNKEVQISEVVNEINNADLDDITDEEKAKLFEELREEYRLEALREKAEHPVRTLFAAIKQSYNDITAAKVELLDSGIEYQTVRTKAAAAIKSVSDRAYTSLLSPIKDVTLDTISEVREKASASFKRAAQNFGKFIGKILVNDKRQAFAMMDVISGGLYTYYIGKQGGLDNTKHSSLKKTMDKELMFAENLINKHPNSAFAYAFYDTVTTGLTEVKENVDKNSKECYDKVETAKMNFENALGKAKDELKNRVIVTVNSVKNKVDKVKLDLLSTYANDTLKKAEFLDEIALKLDRRIHKYETIASDLGKVQMDINNKLSSLVSAPLPQMQEFDATVQCKEILDEIETIKKVIPDKSMADVLIAKREKLISQVEKEYNIDRADFNKAHQAMTDAAVKANQKQFNKVSFKQDINFVKLAGANKTFEALQRHINRLHGKTDTTKSIMKEISTTMDARNNINEMERD